MIRGCLIVLLLWMVIPAGAPAAPGDSSEGDVVAIEVGFIYNFTRFIRWPSSDVPPGRRAFVIAVVGAPSMVSHLSVLERGSHRVDDLPVRVEAVADPGVVPDCSILFVGADAVGQLDHILRQVAGRPVLVIGDTPGLARRGVAINFYLQRGRVRFEINPGALRRAGLTAEAQLFDVARIVE